MTSGPASLSRGGSGMLLLEPRELFRWYGALCTLGSLHALLLWVFLRGAQRPAGVVNILKVGPGFPRQPKWGLCSSPTCPITDLLPDGGGPA